MRTITADQLYKLVELGQAHSISGRWFVEVEVEPAEGEKLAAAQPKAEFLPVEGADHNDLYERAGDAYLRGLGERFRRWTRR